MAGLKGWRTKAVSAVLLVAFAPLLLVVATQAAVDTARIVIEAIGPVIPYAVAVLVLVGVYRLVRGRRL